MLEKGILPRHIGIIMDGNGRWAKKRLLPRTAGHIQGAKAFRTCARYCADIGLECVTFYAFSTENWKRPKDEVSSLMSLFADYLDEAVGMAEKDIRLKFIGDPEPLSALLKEKIKKVEEKTEKNKGLTCCIAINYGGRDEIVHAVRRLAAEGLTGADITEEAISERLYTSGLPDVDLLIRPSGELRISNFMIWQAAYAEYVFMDVLWPDFAPDDLDRAITEYRGRQRRFGGI